MVPGPVAQPFWTLKSAHSIFSRDFFLFFALGSFFSDFFSVFRKERVA